MFPVPRFPPPRRGVTLVAITALACVVASVQASSITDALQVTSSAITMRERDVADARAALARAELGLSASLDVTPVLEYSGAFDSPKVQPELEPGVDARLRAGYRYDATAIAAARIDLVRAESTLTAERRGVVVAALRSQVTELRSRFALTAVQAEFAVADGALTEARAAAEAGEASEGEVRDASLDLELTRSALERAQRDADDNIRNLATLGVPAFTDVPGDRFALPDPSLDDAPRVRLAALQLERTRELSLRNALFGVVGDLQFIGGYAGSDAATYGSVSLDRGRPGVSVDLRYRKDVTDKWVIGIQATLHADDGTLRAFSRSERDVADAEDALEQARASARTRADDARRRAELAREDLDGVLRAVDNSQFRLSELRRALETARQAGASTRDIERAETALSRREATLITQRDRSARSWDAYVVAVGRYLDEVDGEWSLE